MEADCLLHSQKAAGSPYSTRHRGKSRRTYVDDGSEVEAEIATRPSRLVPKRRTLDLDGSLLAGKKDRRPAKDRLFFSNDRNGGVYTLTLQNGETVRVNDCIYLVCEPPSEPYYLARIMEFTRLTSLSTEFNAIRVNWFYRPRDIMRQNSDSRLLFATMHSDVSPLTAIRGKCRIEHRSQIKDPEEYRRQPNSFYYDRLFDRYIHRYYDVIPTDQVLNVPEQVRSVLRERWKYVVVEINRGKELAMQHRACKRCGDWCSSKDSIRCAICDSDFHMLCVQPPLPRKPSRGFAWSCTTCSRAEQRRIESERVPDVDTLRPGGREKWENDRRDRQRLLEDISGDELVSDNFDSISVTRNVSPERSSQRVPVEQSIRPELWPFRYLGLHCNVNDVLDYDDRIYPRAASRIGPKHQAVVHDWPGQPVEYYDTFSLEKADVKRGSRNNRQKKIKVVANIDSVIQQQTLSSLAIQEETLDDLDVTTDNIQPKSDNRLSTDGSNSPSLPWLQPKPLGYVPRGEGNTADLIWKMPENAEFALDAYLEETTAIATKLELSKVTPNFLDCVLRSLVINNFDLDKAVLSLQQLTRKSVGEPTFTPLEKERFEAGVAKHGSELRQVAKDVKTKSVAECVRYYYNWKKTPAGEEIWGNFEGRRPKGEKSSSARARATVMAAEVDRLGESSDDSAFDSEKAIKSRKHFLCKYCATQKSSKWRRAPGGTVVKNTVTALCARCADLWRKYAVQWEAPEDIYKKLHEGGGRGRKRKFEEELIKEQPLAGERPEKLKELEDGKPNNRKKNKSDGSDLNKKGLALQTAPVILAEPCAVCQARNSVDHVTCTQCKLHVHRGCYGALSVDPSKWMCDICRNDEAPLVSTTYECVLCPIRRAIGVSHEAMKRTSGNNWAHISCVALITEVSFGDLDTLQPVEGIGTLPVSIWEKVCVICNTSNGACVTCHACQKPLHVGCAFTSGYTIGFDLQPVKVSRREAIATVRIGGEAGFMSPVLYCPSHDLRRVPFHQLDEVTDAGETAFASFLVTYKVSNVAFGRTSKKGVARSFVTNGNASSITSKIHELRRGTVKKESVDKIGPSIIYCRRCAVDTSPCWYSDSTVSQFNNGDGQQSLERYPLCHSCHWKREHDRNSAERVLAQEEELRNSYLEQKKREQESDSLHLTIACSTDASPSDHLITAKDHDLVGGVDSHLETSESMNLISH